ncbi:MAG: O-antigen ligase family protein [Acidobacteria bacterium]|nr:O-antigen ligase family protein [Acidobacteriota bacterium]
MYVLVAYLVGGIVNTGWRLKLFYWLYILLNLKMAQFVIRSYFWQRKEGVSETFLAGGVGAGSTGFFSDSADLGVAMCVAWALTIPILFSRLNKIPRLFLIGSSMTFLGAILFCGSRGALVGAAAIVAAALFRAPKKLVPVFMATMFLAGLLYLLPTANWARVRSAVDWRNDRNAQSRIALWMVGLHMLRDHPLLGVGIGNYPNAYTRDYVDPAITTRAMACHSMYIQALSETGLTGMAIVLVVLYACFRLNSHTRRRIGMTWPEERQSFEYCLALGLDLALVGFLAGAVFLSVLFYPMLWILVGLSVGLHVACARRQTESETPAPNPRMATE